MHVVFLFLGLMTDTEKRTDHFHLYISAPPVVFADLRGKNNKIQYALNFP